MTDNPRKFEDGIFNFISENELFGEAGEIILAVSGGADSIAMLLCMDAIRDRLKVRLKVVHIEHGIRGQESIEDAEYVDNLCKSLGLECIVVSVDAVKLARDERLSLEEAARKLRYEALFSQGSVVATAHNADDNAETVLFNLIRGTGIAGLCGIEPKSSRGNGCTLIRPLIKTSRADIEEYLKSRGQGFRTDSTNLSTDYSRNRIRLEIMPLLKALNNGAVEHINAASEHLYSVKIITDTYVEARLGEVVTDNGISVSRLLEMDAESRRITLMAYLYNETNGSHNLGSVHFREVESLLDKSVGKRISIPGFEVYRDYDHLRVISANMHRDVKADNALNITINREELSLGPVEYELSGLSIRFNLINCPKAGISSKIPREHYTKWFDYDKIDIAPSLRFRQEGDYFTMDSSLRKKPFRRYCIDEKIPSEVRGTVPLLCDGSHIIWAIGYRISEYYKVSSDTRSVLEVIIARPM